MQERRKEEYQIPVEDVRRLRVWSQWLAEQLAEHYFEKVADLTEARRQWIRIKVKGRIQHGLNLELLLCSLHGLGVVALW